MTSRERAHEWVMDHEQTPYREDIDSLARLLDAHAAERVREVLERAAITAEMMRPHGGRAWTEEQAACFAALSDCAANIRALLKEVVSNG